MDFDQEIIGSTESSRVSSNSQTFIAAFSFNGGSFTPCQADFAAGNAKARELSFEVVRGRDWASLSLPPVTHINDLRSRVLFRRPKPMAVFTIASPLYQIEELRLDRFLWDGPVCAFGG